MSVADKIYQGSVSYGKFTAILGAIIATIVSIFMIVFGINFNKSVKNYSKVSLAEIIGKSCNTNNTNNTNNQNSQTCSYTVSFIDEYNNKNNASFDSNKNFSLNSMVQISYNPNNKNEIRLTTDNTTTTGYVLIGIGIFICIVSWIWVWVTRKYEFAASASGFSSAFKLFNN